jgi:hypothetical protein
VRLSPVAAEGLFAPAGPGRPFSESVVQEKNMKTTESIASRAPSHAAANAARRPAGAAVPRIVLPPIALRGTALRRIAGSRIVLHGLAAALLAGAASTAHAAWTVTNLHPAQATESRAYATDGARQVGSAIISTRRAGLWSGTAASFVDLRPGMAASSEAVGVSGDVQAGRALLSGAFRASLWSGTAASWVDLHPAGADRSAVSGVSGNVQAGSADFAGVRRAGLWSGTAASFVDLHPAGADRSIAGGTAGGQQAGSAQFGGVWRAGLWHGTAASWVDLHPAGAEVSDARATDGAQQVGFARFAWLDRAGLWSGTAASWVSLHPAGAAASQAFGISGGLQAGWADIRGGRRAGLWSGSAASWVDLHALLPGGPDAWQSSEARGVWTDGLTIRVAGFGRNVARDRYEALLWTRPPLANVSGSVRLHGWTAPLTGKRITFEVRAHNSTVPLQTAVAELSATGEFTFGTALPEGFYDVTAKGDRWLRCISANRTFTPTGATELSFFLRAGDVVEDNMVDLSDFLALASTYEASPPTVPTADLNGDGEVDLADFLLLAAHYGGVGAP